MQSSQGPDVTQLSLAPCSQLSTYQDQSPWYLLSVSRRFGVITGHADSILAPSRNSAPKILSLVHTNAPTVALRTIP